MSLVSRLHLVSNLGTTGKLHSKHRWSLFFVNLEYYLRGHLVLLRRALYTLIGEQGPGRQGEGGPTVQGGHRSLTEGWA